MFFTQSTLIENNSSLKLPQSSYATIAERRR